MKDGLTKKKLVNDKKKTQIDSKSIKINLK